MASTVRNGFPFFRASKGVWYCWIEDRQTSLKVKGSSNKKLAYDAWYALLGNTPPTAPLAAPSLTVGELFRIYLADIECRFKPLTVHTYSRDLAKFQPTAIGVNQLRHQDITIWLSKMVVNSTTKAIRLRSLSACLGWAVKQDLMLANPCAKVTKPKSLSRTEAIISESDHHRLLAAASPDFQLVLTVLHATGCRPGEACSMTVENFDAINSVVKLSVHKTDRSGKPRLIFLPPEVVKLLEVQAARYRTGKLLRSRRGHAWDAKAITNAFWRLRAELGISAIAYGYRHSFATRALSAGIPDSHVAALLGHSSTATLHRHYSHLTSQAEVLRAALARV